MGGERPGIADSARDDGDDPRLAFAFQIGLLQGPQSDRRNRHDDRRDQGDGKREGERLG
jgi:hypothetical protein